MSAIEMIPMVQPHDPQWPTTLPGPIETGALVVIDVQAGFGDPALMGPDTTEEMKQDYAAAIDRCIELVDIARAAGLRVIWVGGGAADQLEPWRSLFWLKGRDKDPAFDGFHLTDRNEYSGSFYRVRPAEGETIIYKGRYSAFHGSNIDEVLKEAGITWIITCGLTTECCVGSTTWDAFQRGYRVVVAGDAAACYSRAVHEATLNAMAHNVALVVPVSELGRALPALVPVE